MFKKARIPGFRRNRVHSV